MKLRIVKNKPLENGYQPVSYKVQYKWFGFWLDCKEQDKVPSFGRHQAAEMFAIDFAKRKGAKLIKIS